jgi:tetratricopeptide (TPR) repeat protein
MTLAPNAEEVLVAQAQLALARRAPVAALAPLDRLTRLYPTVAEHHYLMGVALLQAGDPPRATEALENAIHLDPEHTLTLVALGLALNERKLYDESQKHLRRALEREPENADVLAALAEAEEGVGQLADAEAHATQALGRSGQHARGNLVIGLLRMHQEKYAEAKEALLRSVAAEPTSPKAHYQLSLAYARLGDAAAAAREKKLYDDARQALVERAEEQHAARTNAASGGMGR